MNPASHLPVVLATFHREMAEHRLNRFLHVHLALSLVIGLLPFFTPEATGRAAPLWVLQGVLYCLSLSALLLGLSAAHGDAEEFALLFTQPISRAAWLGGKVAALTMLVWPAAVLLVLPAAMTSGMSTTLVALAAASAGVCLVVALLGLAIGFWVRDPVRGLLLALGLWFALLFGTDLALLAVAGAPWLPSYQAAWVLPLMVNPLDALRILVLFSLEQTAPSGIGSGWLVSWWLAHGGTWLAVLLSAWTIGAFTLGLCGANRRGDV